MKIPRKGAQIMPRDDEPQGVMHTGCNHFRDGEIGFQAAAHISVEKIFHIVHILDEDRLIQAEFFTDRFHLFHAGFYACEGFCRITGDQMNEHEDKDRNDEHQWNGCKQPSDKIAIHTYLRQDGLRILQAVHL